MISMQVMPTPEGEVVVPLIVCDQCHSHLQAGDAANVVFPVFPNAFAPGGRTFGRASHLHSTCVSTFTTSWGDREWHVESLLDWLPRVAQALLTASEVGQLGEMLDHLP